MDHVSRWQITDPLLFYRTVRNETGAMARLDQVIAGRLREEIAKHNFIDIVREKREAIVATVTDGTQEAATSFGIKLLDVRIMRIDLPNEVQASVFARMQAERERIAKRYRAEGEEKALETRAAADKQREIILATAYGQSQSQRGEGDARAAASPPRPSVKTPSSTPWCVGCKCTRRSWARGRRSCCRRNRTCCATWNRRSLCRRLTPSNCRP